MKWTKQAKLPWLLTLEQRKVHDETSCDLGDRQDAQSTVGPIPPEWEDHANAWKYFQGQRKEQPSSMQKGTNDNSLCKWPRSYGNYGKIRCYYDSWVWLIVSSNLEWLHVFTLWLYHIIDRFGLTVGFILDDPVYPVKTNVQAATLTTTVRINCGLLWQHISAGQNVAKIVSKIYEHDFN